MKPENTRPFDPHNRPLKGEWVVLQEGDAGETMSIPMGDADAGYTQGVDAVKRAPAEKKKVPVMMVVVAILTLGIVAYFIIAQNGNARPIAPKVQPNVSNTGTASDGPPELNLVADRTKHEARNSTYVFNVELHVEGSSLDEAKPAEFEVIGKGKVLSQKMVGTDLVVQIERGGPGELKLKSLNYKAGARENSASPKFDSVKWNAAGGVE